MNNIYVYNTLTGQKEVLKPQTEKEVRMYVCGITPYDVCHLGHARCYVVFDMIRRVLRAQGYQVRYVQNFTDVDDKIIARSAEIGLKISDLVRQNIDDYYSKMDALGVQRADLYPRVTEHIPDMIAMIRKLLDKKVAYRLGGDVYFSVKQYPAYGKLSKRPLEDLQSGTRVDINKEKKDPLDFALWKASKPGEPPEASWEAPWGRGRPGWHIECSVMALKHLGANFDIHGGGLDLVFPHHENEIAQSEAATGLPFANVWIHNGFVTLNREKMSKSTGNFFTLSEIFAKYHPSIVRYMLLTVHYRSPLHFSEELLSQSRQSLSRLKDDIARATFIIRKQGRMMDQSKSPLPEVVAEVDRVTEDLHQALTDDFNTPEALAALHRLAGILEKQFETNAMQLASIRYTLDRLQSTSSVLGLDLFSFMQGIFVPSEVTELCRQREAARTQKDWKEADRLRQAILEHGYVVEDTPDGPRLLPKASA